MLYTAQTIKILLNISLKHFSRTKAINLFGQLPIFGKVML